MFCSSCSFLLHCFNQIFLIFWSNIGGVPTKKQQHTIYADDERQQKCSQLAHVVWVKRDIGTDFTRSLEDWKAGESGWYFGTGDVSWHPKMRKGSIFHVEKSNILVCSAQKLSPGCFWKRKSLRVMNGFLNSCSLILQIWPRPGLIRLDEGDEEALCRDIELAPHVCMFYSFQVWPVAWVLTSERRVINVPEYQELDLTAFAGGKTAFCLKWSLFHLATGKLCACRTGHLKLEFCNKRMLWRSSFNFGRRPPLRRQLLVR